MLSYIEKVTEDLLVTCILCGLLYVCSAQLWGKKGKTAQKAGILLGIAAAAAMAWVKNTTSLIATNTWNLYIFYVGLGLTALFLLLAVIARKDKSAALSVTAASVGGLLTADLIFYELPDVIAYPFNFNIGDNSVWSMEFFRRFAGWALALLLLYIFTACMAWCVRKLNRPGMTLAVLAVELLVNAVRFFGMILGKWLARPRVYTFFVKADHPWAFPFAVYVSNNELVFFFVALALAAVLPVILFTRSTRVTDPYDNPAQLRRLKSIARRSRRWVVAVVLCIAVLTVNMTVVRAYNHQEVTLSEPETYTFSEDKTQILIAVEDVNDGHLHRFEYTTSSGTDVRWIIIKKPNAASFGIGLDACDVCGTAGYYERNDTVVCKRCDVVMNINTIGFKGGCNPIPINYKVENGYIVFELSDIIAAEKNF